MEKTQKRLGKAEQKYKRFIPESSPVSYILASRSLLLSMDSDKLMALLCSKLRRYYSPLWCLRTTHSHHQWPGSGFLNPALYSNLFALWASISSSCSSHSPYFLPLDHCGPETSVWWTAVDKRSSPTWATFSLKDTTTSWMQKSQILPIKSLFYTLFKQLSASVTAGFAPHPTHRATHMDMSIHQAWDHGSDMLLVQSTAKKYFGLVCTFDLVLYCFAEWLCFHLGRLHLRREGPWQARMKKALATASSWVPNNVAKLWPTVMKSSCPPPSGCARNYHRKSESSLSPH